MTREECEAQAYADYLAVLGKVIEVTVVCGYYRGDEQGLDDVQDITCDPPALMRVAAAQCCEPDKLPGFWHDDFLDMVYDEVILLEPHPALEQYDGLFIYGPSYEIGKGKHEAERWTLYRYKGDETT